MAELVFTDDINDLVFDEIYPNVIVYRNMLKDPQKAFDIMSKSESSSDGKYYLNKWTNGHNLELIPK